jgi:Methyltransferase domain
MRNEQFARLAKQGSGYLKWRMPKLHRFLSGQQRLQSLYSAAITSRVVVPEVNELLHQLRSAHLRRMPKVQGTMLSAGCAGLWYFDWIRKCTGHRSRHIGIEFYTPKPEGLPDNVDWIGNTVGNMIGVSDGGCQLVFSGENLEHLWPEEVIGFFEESNRVLEPGGWLVIDSPNRLVTAPLNWSHPEHTVELTPSEAARLAALAGFELVGLSGLWLCRDPQTSRILSFSPGDEEEGWSFAERVVIAESDPDNSFIWWLTARKTSLPKSAELADEMMKIFANAWPERKRRFLSLVGKTVQRGSRATVRCDQGERGPLLYGPYMPLKRGSHIAEFEIRASGAPNVDAPVVQLDVLGNGGRGIVTQMVSSRDLERSAGKVRLKFQLTELEFGIQARCISLGNAAIECTAEILDGQGSLSQ